MSSQDVTTLVGLAPGKARRGARFRAAALWDTVRAMIGARSSRRLLAEMDGRMLANIGVSPAQAHMEASRPFWDIARR